MAGQHFCVSFYRPDNAGVCEEIGQSVLWDNGAFSHWSKGGTVDERALYEWLEPRLYHPHRAVVLDVIDAPVEVQRDAAARWPMPRDLSWPVWHLDKPLDYLSELADEWPGVCLGSAGEYKVIGTPSWRRKMDEAFNHLMRRGRLPWLHGLRMLGQVSEWPLASADSTNVAQNYGRDTGCARCKADALNRLNHGRPTLPPMEGELVFTEPADA